MTQEQKPKKTWVRATQITGKFPEDKYGFTKNLTNVGDWVMTQPISRIDSLRMKWAAHQWAWRNNCRVSIRRWRNLDDTYSVQVTLKAKIRIREFE